ncbi:T-complex 11, partial [Globomyces pollinis-pini]
EAFNVLLLKATKYNDHDIVPETLKMDLSRLVSFFNSWQDITILSSILVVYKQAAGPKCTLEDLISTKKLLWVLLNDSESTMSHITLQMGQLAGKVRERPFTKEEVTGLHAVTEKTLAPDSKLYELLQKRVGLHLQNGISNLKMDMEMLGKHGLLPVQSEIEELIKKMVQVTDLNKAIYGKLYSSILDDIKAGLSAESPSSKAILFST